MINRQRKTIGALLLAVALASAAAFANTPPAPAPAAQPAAAPAQPAAAAEAAKQKGNTTADHAKFKELQQAFKSGPEVTKACLACHTEAAKQIHGSKHWKWEVVNKSTGQKLGKKNVANNFCININSNFTGCTSCHIGYGWKDKQFDFASQENVDCLVCHETTGAYRKLPGDSGHPVYAKKEFPPHSGRFVEPPDLAKVAQSVGKTSRDTCGACHFFGGGGDAVKHGDLDSSLKKPGKYLDVHMDAKGLNFSCAKCHVSDTHEVAGSRYTPTAADKEGAHLRGKKDDTNPATCQACHGQKPHSAKMAKLNEHTSKIACQTCHIPEFARGGPATKMRWDWSTATKMGADGKPLEIKDSAGRIAYTSKKGDFTWETNVIPEYAWFNGNVEYTLVGDKIDPSKTVSINKISGSPDDPNSRIWPFKVHRGKQPYDMESNSLIVPHTFGNDDNALWNTYDWNKSLKAGMEVVGLPFSGKFGFVETEMSWPIAHMVAPKDDALACAQCHSKNGRLKDVPGVYMPARDGKPWLDIIGWTAALLTLLGVLFHGGLRIYLSKRKG